MLEQEQDRGAKLTGKYGGLERHGALGVFRSGSDPAGKNEVQDRLVQQAGWSGARRPEHFRVLERGGDPARNPDRLLGQGFEHPVRQSCGLSATGDEAEHQRLEPPGTGKKGHPVAEIRTSIVRCRNGFGQQVVYGQDVGVAWVHGIPLSADP